MTTLRDAFAEWWSRLHRIDVSFKTNSLSSLSWRTVVKHALALYFDVEAARDQRSAVSDRPIR